MNEETTRKVLTWETDIAKMSHDDFVKMLKCLDRMYFSRVMNCVDGTGRFDKEWTALSCIFRRVVEAITEKPSGNSAATATTEKSSVVGNSAKPREALNVIRRMVNEELEDLKDISDEVRADFISIRGWCDEALAKPPRNCDRFNSGDCNKDVVDASLAWDKFCAEHYPPGTPVVPKTPYSFWSWVFAPATQKGATDGK